jgi:dipeptidyl-peptidase-3
MPYDTKYRKPTVTGIVANAIDVVIETGDSGPVTPIGINLPNDQGIREQYGSKSVSLANVNDAYDKSQPESMRSEFSWSPEETARAAKFGSFGGELTTDMHEVIGHASGRQAAGFKGTPQGAIKEQFSALEEARADLVGLYFLLTRSSSRWASPLRPTRTASSVPSTKSYTRNALTQLRRIREGTQIEEDHMRNRQMIVRWLMANTKPIESRTRDGKSYPGDGRSEGVPRGHRPAARRSAAHQVRRRLRRGESAVRDPWHPLRVEAARRDRQSGWTT